MLAISGVGASLVLVLVLDGIFAGAMRQVSAYIRSSPADVFVAQEDVRTMHMTQSALPPATVDQVRAVDGVAWAEGLRYTTSIVESTDGRQLTTYVFGFDTATGRGGPRHLAAGRTPAPARSSWTRPPPTSSASRSAAPSRSSRPRHPAGQWPVHRRHQHRQHHRVHPDRGLRPPRRDTVAYVLAGADPGVDADTLAHRVAQALPDTTVQTA